MAIELWDLRVGDVVELGQGILASILLPTEDGRWVLVSYEAFPDSPELVGQTDLVSEAEIARVFRSSTN